MICFRASWLRTALAGAVVTTTIPVRALAQTTAAILDTTSAQTGSPTTSPVSSGAVGSGSSGPTAPADFYFRAGAVLDWPKETRVTSQDLETQGYVEVDDLLRTTVPSYQVGSHPIDDAGTLVRPAKLRGLAPDQTLVLVNGQRRHRSAVINFISDGLTQGVQGPDLSVIPAGALERVEVLRDGRCGAVRLRRHRRRD